PDRQSLLEGTGLDLYQSFDALLIATPNPRDDTVTFLAARHHLSDRELRAGLEAGARQTGHTLTWHTERHRPVAERRLAAARPEAAGGGGGVRRDDRLLVMPAPGLVVVTPPVYRSLLLQPRPPRAPGGGQDGARDAGARDGGGSPGGERGEDGEREG